MQVILPDEQVHEIQLLLSNLIKQEIMYRLHEKINFAYEILGEAGCGKTTLINNIKKSWLNKSEGVVLTLYAPNQIPSNDYDVFKELIIEKVQGIDTIKNILV